MKNIFIALLSILWISGYAQRPIELVEAYQIQGKEFKEIELLEVSNSKSLAEVATELQNSPYDILEVDMLALEQLLKEAPKMMQFNIPTTTKGVLEVELVQVNLFTPDFQVTESHTNAAADVKLGKFYRGIIKNDPNSIVALSLFDDEVRGLFSSSTGNLVLGKLNSRQLTGKHILYNDHEVLANLGIHCETSDDGKAYSIEALEYTADEKALSDCVSFYIEADHDVVTDKGGTQGAVNYLTGLYNEVSTLYANESINTVISEIFTWTSTSPYASSSSSGMLSQFQSYRTTWNGDLASLVSYQASGGIAAGFDGICNSDRTESMSFSSINSTYNIVPTYSWSVSLATHELGHLFGSRHTHACVWNGNGTAIDGCAGYTEGSCSTPGYPSGGGTIMSYCHWQSVGINFNNGFGPQPGNVIRNNVTNATCLLPCEAGCEDVLVLDDSDPGTLMGTETYAATLEIQASNDIAPSADVDYHAGDRVLLMPGFLADNGCSFHAFLEACSEGRAEPGEEDSSTPSNPTESNLSLSQSTDTDFAVFPNPMDNVASIKINLQREASISLQLMSIDGRLSRTIVNDRLLDQGLQQFDLHKNDLLPGIYILKMQSSTGETKVKKLVIQ
jgi:hypothetical protein